MRSFQPELMESRKESPVAVTADANEVDVPVPLPSTGFKVKYFDQIFPNVSHHPYPTPALNLDRFKVDIVNGEIIVLANVRHSYFCETNVQSTTSEAIWSVSSDALSLILDVLTTYEEGREFTLSLPEDDDFFEKNVKNLTEHGFTNFVIHCNKTEQLLASPLIPESKIPAIWLKWLKWSLRNAHK